MKEHLGRVLGMKRSFTCVGSIVQMREYSDGDKEGVFCALIVNLSFFGRRGTGIRPRREEGSCVFLSDRDWS